MEEVGEEEDVGADEEFSAERGEEYGEEEGSCSVENDREAISVPLSNKRIKEMSIDRLSALPDALLIHILSYLGVKKAAITSVLSKRWQYLYTESPRLRFQESSTQAEKIRKFVCWVHRTLVLRSGNYLEQFEVEFVYDNCFASDVNFWVEFAVKNEVKQLTLLLDPQGDVYTLPQLVYSNSSLTWLWVQRCIVAPQRTIEWQSLTELCIEDAELHDHVIQKILSGCPVLHSLDLRACWGFKSLEVSSQSLYSLGVSDCEDENTGHLLEISAPYLRYLDISLYLIGRKKLRLTNIPSLIRADIDFCVFDISDEEMNNTMELFENIQHVKELELGYHCIEVLSKLVVNGWQLPQSRRECLIINAYRDEDNISGILGLLESSPNLQRLVIQCYHSYEESFNTWGPVARDDLNCDLLHLKTVNLIDYADPELAGEPMLKVAKILLKRATVLEKMVVDAKGSLTKFSSDFIEMAQTLLSFPRSSQKAVVVFHQ